MTPDPAHRHGGPGAGWYRPGPDGWQRITDAEANEHRYPDMAHFMHDPRTVTGMADREQDALDCAARRREREAHPPESGRYVCRCDHGHPAGVSWCDLCENPVYGPDEAAP